MLGSELVFLLLVILEDLKLMIICVEAFLLLSFLWVFITGSELTINLFKYPYWSFLSYIYV